MGRVCVCGVGWGWSGGGGEGGCRETAAFSVSNRMNGLEIGANQKRAAAAYKSEQSFLIRDTSIHVDLLLILAPLQAAQTCFLPIEKRLQVGFFFEFRTLQTSSVFFIFFWLE